MRWTYSIIQVFCMESGVLDTLEFCLTGATTKNFLRRFLKAAGGADVNVTMFANVCHLYFLSPLPPLFFSYLSLSLLLPHPYQLLIKLCSIFVNYLCMSTALQNTFPLSWLPLLFVSHFTL